MAAAWHNIAVYESQSQLFVSPPPHQQQQTHASSTGHRCPGGGYATSWLISTLLSASRAARIGIHFCHTLSLSVLFFSDKPYVFSDTKSMPLRVFYVYYPFCLCSLLSSMPFFNSHSHSYTSQPAIHATHSSTLLHIYTGNNVERYDIRYVCINFSQYVYSPLRLECCRRRTGWPPTNAPQNSVC